ncbi:MAG: DUF4251 domain-containing protein [Prevotella sp.]|jgi:outer membrane lipoprotein-sorting protein|nr:DUF4251 domain-containing protein [Prevotella sp.]
MKKLLLGIVAALLLVACATAEERAAREAENMKMVKQHVGSQQYRIIITQMRPMRGTSHQVANRYLKVDGKQLDCSLPYVGRDDIPQFKTRGEIRMDSKIEFSGALENYLLQLNPKEKCGIVTFSTNYAGENMKFNIVIDKEGNAKIRLTPESRDFIDYEGYIN